MYTCQTACASSISMERSLQGAEQCLIALLAQDYLFIMRLHYSNSNSKSETEAVQQGVAGNHDIRCSCYSKAVPEVQAVCCGDFRNQYS